QTQAPAALYEAKPATPSLRGGVSRRSNPGFQGNGPGLPRSLRSLAVTEKGVPAPALPFATGNRSLVAGHWSPATLSRRVRATIESAPRLAGPRGDGGRTGRPWT